MARKLAPSSIARSVLLSCAMLQMSFFSMVDLDFDDVKLDIHHILPKKWWEAQKIPRRIFNSIVNKTAISYKANRMVGGSAPSKYLAQLQTRAQVQLADPDMDAILRSHAIDPGLLRADAFEAFYAAREAALLELVVNAMGKAPTDEVELYSDEGDDEETDDAA